jgi:hypothetical protein
MVAIPWQWQLGDEMCIQPKPQYLCLGHHIFSSDQASCTCGSMMMMTMTEQRRDAGLLLQWITTG